MARITVEDCLEKVDNRFGLIHLAAKRVRQLRKGAEPLVECKNKDIVVALREIAAGEVYQVKNSEKADQETALLDDASSSAENAVQDVSADETPVDDPDTARASEE